MKRSFLDSVLRGAEALAARDPVGALADPDLLRGQPASLGTREEKIEIAVIPLKNGKAEEFAKELKKTKVLGGSKATFAVTYNSLIVAGPTGVVRLANGRLQPRPRQQGDRPAGGRRAGKGCRGGVRHGRPPGRHRRHRHLARPRSKAGFAPA
jgi:hypothetical protein